LSTQAGLAYQTLYGTRTPGSSALKPCVLRETRSSEFTRAEAQTMASGRQNSLLLANLDGAARNGVIKRDDIERVQPCADGRFVVRRRTEQDFHPGDRADRSMIVARELFLCRADACCG
jgi:hypothetical protein